MIGREINAAIPVTLFLLISVTLYGFYDNLSGVDEGSDLDLIDPAVVIIIDTVVRSLFPLQKMLNFQ